MVRELRISEGLTQKSLALLTGRSQPLLSNIETNRRKPSRETLEMIAEACNKNLKISFERRNLVRLKSFDEELMILVPRLRKDCYRLCRNKNNIDDLLQEVMFIALSKHNTLKPGVQMYTWLYGIARRQALLADSKLGPVNEYVEHAEEYPEFKQTKYSEGIYRYINSLPKHRRDLYKLQVTGMPYTEIAAKLNLTVGTVKNKVRNIRENLKRMIDAETNTNSQ